MEITAKGVETMACGVARYFPFVYVYYDEGQKNFGMMGREATPLRSMAAYAMSIQTLSGKKYRGDLSGLDSAATLARVFGTAGSDENVAVLYTGKVDKDAKIAIPAGVLRVAGADGRTLLVSGGMLPIPDGLAYAWMDAASLQKNLKTDTPAMALYQSGQHPLEQKRLASPLVLQFMAEDTPARTSARRYLVTREAAQAFPLHVRIHNLSREPVAFTPEWSLPGEPGEKAAPVSVPALGSVEIAWKPDISAALDIAQTRLISISGKTESGAQPSPLAIPVVMDGTMEEHLKRHKNQTPLPIAELGKWKQNIAAEGKTKFSATAADGILADFTFAGVGGWWTYPKLELPGKIDATLYSGLLVRARIMKSASPLAIIADPGDGSPSFWVSDLFPADGEWHVVYVPFAEFKPGPNGTGNQNTRLNPASWKELCIGMGSNVPENSFEMSHLLLVGGSGD